MTAWMRSRRPSFCSIRATCVLVVASLTTGRSQLSPFDNRRGSRSSTSVSRAVRSASAPGRVGASRCRANSSTTLRVTAGASRASPPATTRTAAAISSGGTSSSSSCYETRHADLSLCAEGVRRPRHMSSLLRGTAAARQRAGTMRLLLASYLTIDFGGFR
jgi:hypothetical protein